MYAATAAETFPEFIPGQMLDELLPLRGASHRDVVRYFVEIPMRYAECFALLRDGRKVGLADKRKFVGWSDGDESRSFLFRQDSQHIELLKDGDDSFAYRLNPHGEYVGIDGSLIRQ